MKKKLLFIQFNEINFKILQQYNLNEFKNFSFILEKTKLSSSEDKYDLLEPWIQWVSAYTGKSAEEHQILRLGDVVKNNVDQIFETVENIGFSVGAILPMNCSNKLKNAKYFIPDPWTQTKPNNSFWVKLMTEVFSKVVNDNAKNEISIISYIKLLLIFLNFSNKKNLFIYLKLIFGSRKFTYKKVLFFDLLLHDIHIKFLNKYNTDFSSIFFNGCAHIQHHYFFNSKVLNKKTTNPNWYIDDKKDPLYEILLIYDKILGEYLMYHYDLILATGLRQIPSEDPIFYYRLKNHKKFLDFFEIDYKNVFPRMTRDFLIEFENENKRDNAKNILESLVTENNEKIFSEVDSRKNSLFVTLGYSKEVKENNLILSDKKKISFYENIAFVGLKNGIHDQEGYVYFSDNIEKGNFQNNSHIKNLFNIIKEYFYDQK